MSGQDRLHSLDAVRGFALLLGIVFHGAFSFIPGMFPGIWAAVDNSPSHAVSAVLFVSHIFRMSLFFFIAGFFARLAFHRKGAGGFWGDRLKRIAGPMIVGWIVLFPVIGAVWGWGISRTFNGAPPAMPPMPPPPPGTFPMTHLWFLYYLLVLYAVVVATRSVVVLLDRSGAIRNLTDKVVSGSVRSGVAGLLLALPLTAALYYRENWMMWFGIPTPDHSLIPELASVVGFGTAFAFGWLVHRQVELLQAWARSWLLHLAVALGASVLCVYIAGTAPKFVPASEGVGTLTYAFAYCVAIWCWTFAITGAAVRFLSNESPVRRYIADSSYWMYLVHLPVVAFFQVVVAQLPLHWSVKLPMVLVPSFALLLVSYHLLVRFTWVGAVLNGRKHKRGKPAGGDIQCLDGTSESRSPAGAHRS